MRKICSGCKQSKDQKKFNKKKKGLQPFCKLCQRKYFKNFYQKNKNNWREKYKESAERFHLGVHQYIVGYLKSHPCIDCGQTNILVLEFDHIGEKIHDISQMIAQGFGTTALAKEIKKCVVRCSNCHKIKTAKSNNNWKLKYL